MTPETRHFMALRRRGLSAAGGTGRTLAATVELVTDQGLRTPQATLPLLSPGDVQGIEPGRIARRWPAPGSGDARGNTMAYVEFTEDDLPWALSDLGTSTRLLPWLALVVVKDDADATLSHGRDPLPVLSLGAAAHAKLHDPAGGWAYAHCEAVPGTVADGAAPDDATPALSRLLCPRRLEPGRAYIAALVPVFEAGRLRGLGRAPTATEAHAFGPTVTLAPDARLELPVYESWRFSTSLLPRFEDVVKRLRPFVASPVAPRAAASHDTQQALPLTEVSIRSALRVPGSAVPDPSRATVEKLDDLTHAEDVIGPPRWGARHADPQAATPWRDMLNRDPTLRMAAGHGARIVRDRQDELARAAWDFAGEVEGANLLLARARAAAIAGRRGHAAAAAQPPERVLAVLTAVMDRTRRPGSPPFRAALVGTPLGATTTPEGRAALRRAARTRQGATGPADDLPAALSAVTQRHAEGFLPVGRPVIDFAGSNQSNPRRFVPTEGVARIENLDQLLDERFDARLPGETRPPDGLGPALDLVANGPGADAEVRAVPTADAPALAAELLAATEPRRAIEARVAPLISGLPPRGDPLAPVRLEPILPLPLIDALAAISPALVAPALARMPENSATLLELDAPFCEAVFVGANHELSRELLWRRFPGDLSISPLRRMFPTQEAGGTGTTPLPRDTAPLASWRGALGSHITAAPETVILLRTPLFRIFPRVIAFLVPAVWKGPLDRALAPFDAATVRPGRVRGALPPDAAYMGFDLDAATLIGAPERPASGRGGEGYYLVFHGPRDENSFGFDAPDPGAPSSGAADDTRWDEMGWTEAAPNMRSQGAASGASIAALASERPFTMAIHVSDLVGR